MYVTISIGATQQKEVNNLYQYQILFNIFIQCTKLTRYNIIHIGRLASRLAVPFADHRSHQCNSCPYLIFKLILKNLYYIIKIGRLASRLAVPFADHRSHQCNSCPYLIYDKQIIIIYNLQCIIGTIYTHSISKHGARSTID